KYLRTEAVEPKFRVPERPSKIDLFAEKLSHGCGLRAASRANTSAPSSRSTLILWPWASMALTAVWPPLPAVGKRSACANKRIIDGHHGTGQAMEKHTV